MKKKFSITSPKGENDYKIEVTRQEFGLFKLNIKKGENCPKIVSTAIDAVENHLNDVDQFSEAVSYLSGIELLIEKSGIYKLTYPHKFEAFELIGMEFIVSQIWRNLPNGLDLNQIQVDKAQKAIFPNWYKRKEDKKTGELNFYFGDYEYNEETYMDSDLDYPILCAQVPDNYGGFNTIIDGSNRVAKAIETGVEVLPCIVVPNELACKFFDGVIGGGFYLDTDGRENIDPDYEGELIDADLFSEMLVDENSMVDGFYHHVSKHDNTLIDKNPLTVNRDENFEHSKGFAYGFNEVLFFGVYKIGDRLAKNYADQLL